MSQKIQYPASERNKQPILEVLQKHIPTNTQGNLLEIASGTGQHASFFAEHFPKLIFHPSEYDYSLFASLRAYAKDTPTKNVRDPIEIDVTTPYTSWNLSHQHYDYILNINMIHISPYSSTIGLFQNCSKLLKPNGLMIMYGPYACDGVIIPESNINFDRGLRMQNKEWGLRDIQDLKSLAAINNMELIEKYNLPANNMCLIWKQLTNTD
ncbi:hypothetical protein RN001_000941 [Aquatica leii]|uniref:Uncharacterized protein n=1 Tax=Aquatica leii TaxID=1421715 RepID=A0AAN7SSJ4_9COLE|nr:hypothetical protein RN001_000941 [Aquatica leii]